MNNIKMSKVVLKPPITDESEKYKRFSQMSDHTSNIIDSLNKAYVS